MSSDLRQTLEQMQPWYHRITVVDDIETPAKAPNIVNKLKIIEPYLPSDLVGARVLDFGCNAGGMSIELARRGANCVGIEANNHYFAQAEWLAEKTGLSSRVRFINASAYFAASMRETFDVVLFMGIIYHLRYPQLALDICRGVCQGTMFMNSPVVVSKAPILENRLPRGPNAGKFVPFSDELAHGWWYASRPALEAMMIAAGFEKTKVIWSKDTPFVASSPVIDNSSDFPTASVFYCAWAGSNPVDTAKQLLGDLNGTRSGHR